MEESWAKRAERVFLRNYYPARISLVRGEGCRVFDEAGKSYLDLVGGIAVNSLGHYDSEFTRSDPSQRAVLCLGDSFTLGFCE